MKQILALLFLAGLAAAQPANPDCGPITFSFAGGNGTAGDVNGAAYFDNRARACDSWTVSYQADPGLSGYTLALLYSTGTGSPGSFIAWPANQSNAQSSFGTATNGLATFCNLATCVPSAGVTFNTPWVQVKVSGASGNGNLNGVIYGYRTGSSGAASSGGGGSGCPNPCPVTQDTTPWIVAQTGLSTFGSNQQGVTESAVALGNHTAKSVCVKALSTNTSSVFVGASGVSDSTGFELPAGQGLCVNLANSDLIYVIAADTSENVSYEWTN